MAKVITALVLFACALAAPQALAQDRERLDAYETAATLRAEAGEDEIEAKVLDEQADEIFLMAKTLEIRAKELEESVGPVSDAADDLSDLADELGAYSNDMSAKIFAVTVTGTSGAPNNQEWLRGMNGVFRGFSHAMSASSEELRLQAATLNAGAEIIESAANEKENAAEKARSKAEKVRGTAREIRNGAMLKRDHANALMSIVGGWRCKGAESDKEKFTEIFGDRYESPLVYHSYYFDKNYNLRQDVSFMSSYPFMKTREHRITAKTLLPRNTAIDLRVDVTATILFSSLGNSGQWTITAGNDDIRLAFAGDNSDGSWEINESVLKDTIKSDIKRAADWLGKDPSVDEKRSQHLREAEAASRTSQRQPPQFHFPSPPQTYTWDKWERNCDKIRR